jgi:ATP-dependent DNA helicase DinG
LSDPANDKMQVPELAAALAGPDGWLDDGLKSRIQSAYRTWLDARGFRPRRGQREMIAAIARCFTRSHPPRLLVVEAGTGTGKTAAYSLAALPVAQTLEKRLVVATATVALQEQIVERDLPDLQARTGLSFNTVLAKGRGRYLCVKRLDERLASTDRQSRALFEAPPDSDSLALYQRMLERFSGGEWDGELDSWSDGVEPEQWAALTTDHRGCTNSKCTFFRECPFFRARAQIDKADLVVTNLDLLLADLALGGGAILPAPEDSLYVLDEAHHLPAKTQQHFTLGQRLRASAQWLEQLEGQLGTLLQRVGRPEDLAAKVQDLGGLAAPLVQGLNNLMLLAGELDYQPRDERQQVCRFVLGRVPPALAGTMASQLPDWRSLSTRLDEIDRMLQEAMDGTRNWPKSQEVEDWLSVVGQHLQRCLGLQALFEDYAGAMEAPAPGNGDAGDAVMARWILRWQFEAGEEFELVSAPLDPGNLLETHLWSRCYGALCTSATLSALGRFDRFLERAGLTGSAETLRIASPFRYPEIASLHVPAMQADPRDAAAHTAELIRLLPELLADSSSALVLFSSWRQMREVVDALPESLSDSLQVQGRGSKQALLDTHRARVDAGEASYLLGVASFAEGVDLPDDYCRHVVIAKLPFAVPDEPLDQAAAEWLEARGGNAFFEISLPDAAIRLVQACGRLIRHEQDHGRITLLDRRILTQRYGRALLKSLPPFRQVFE